MKIGKIGPNTKFNITLIGCGGTGGQFLPFLMQLCNNFKYNVSKITLIDGDIFEDKNCKNQRCLPEEVGMNKAEALAERWGHIYEDLNIEFYGDYIRRVIDLQRLVSTRTNFYSERDESISIVIGAVDKNSARKLFHEYFTICNQNKRNLIYIDSGNGDVDRIGQIITGITHKGNVLSRPVADYFPEILEDKEDLTKLTNCTKAISKNPQNIATNVMAASILFSVVTNIISFGKIEKGVIYFDADKHTVISR